MLETINRIFTPGLQAVIALFVIVMGLIVLHFAIRVFEKESKFLTGYGFVCLGLGVFVLILVFLRLRYPM